MRSDIITAAQMYYSGTPIMSDVEFDKLVEDYRDVNPNDSILQTPGWGYRPDPGKVKAHHKYGIVGSLGKIKSGDSFPELSDMVLAMPKLDGGSVVSYYVNGELQKIVSRGDGSVGIDITRNLFGAVPRRILPTINVGIRSEVVISNEDFAEFADGYSHPRNLAVATAQRLEPNDMCKLLKLISYSIAGIEDWSKQPLSKEEQLIWLMENGFETVSYKKMSLIEFKIELDDPNFYKYLKASSINPHYTYPTDGIVIAQIGNEINFSGNVKNSTIFQTNDIAYKFEDKTAETIVEKVIWDMSWNGRLVPTLKVQTVNLEGAEINYVTANNYEWLEENKCGIGATLLIKRANQVVPNIETTVNGSMVFNQPRYCGFCQTRLELKGRDIVCPNEECAYKILGRSYNIWQSIKPDGASDSTFWRMVGDPKEIIEKYDKKFKNFWEIDKNQIDSENHYDRLIIQFLTNWGNHKCKIRDFIKYANIPLLGRTIGKRIEGDIASIEEFCDYIHHGFPKSVFKYAVLNEHLANLQFVLNIVGADNIMIDEITNDKPILKVAVTGKLSLPRNKWFEKYELFGVEKSSINKDTFCLVTNDTTSGSSTLKKAIKFNTKILTEKEFEECLGENI